MKFRLASLFNNFRVIAIAVCLLSLSESNALVQGVGGAQSGQRSLSNSAKLARAKTLFKTTAAFKTISDSLSLSVNRPTAANRGCLSFSKYSPIFTGYDKPGTAHTAGGSEAKATVEFNVSQAGKRYILTYHVDTSTPQTLRFEVAGHPTQMVESYGATFASIVLTSKSAGRHTVRMTTTGSMRFYSVDVDAVN